MRYPRLIEFGQVDIALCQAYTPHRDLLRRSGSDRLKDHRRDRVLRIDRVEPRREQPRIASEPRRLGHPGPPGLVEGEMLVLRNHVQLAMRRADEDVIRT